MDFFGPVPSILYHLGADHLRGFTRNSLFETRVVPSVEEDKTTLEVICFHQTGIFAVDWLLFVLGDGSKLVINKRLLF